jgi:UDP-glucose 4-epimerase
VLKGEAMTMFGDGLQTRAFSHIDDVAPIIARSPEVPEAYNDVFNVGADTPSTVLEISRIIAEAFECPHNVKFLPARNEVIHAFANHAKTQEVFGSGATVDIRTGIKRMAEWVKGRGAATPVTFDNIEIEKNLPPSWKP